MNEQDVLVTRLIEFQVKPGLMSLEDLNLVLDFYLNYQHFIESEILALHGELTELNKVGQWNVNAMNIEKAEWYINYLTNKEKLNAE